jgi:hypothetical protein
VRRVKRLAVAWAMFLAGAGSPAGAEPLDDAEAFLAAVTRGDVAHALALLDEEAVYQGLLVCAPSPCVGRAAIAAALAAEVDDGTAFELWRDAGDPPAGRMRCQSLAPRRLAYTLRVEAGPGGIVALRLTPDARDPETRGVLDALAAVRTLLDEARAIGADGPVTLGAPSP